MPHEPKSIQEQTQTAGDQKSWGKHHKCRPIAAHVPEKDYACASRCDNCREIMPIAGWQKTPRIPKVCGEHRHRQREHAREFNWKQRSGPTRCRVKRFRRLHVDTNLTYLTPPFPPLRRAEADEGRWSAMGCGGAFPGHNPNAGGTVVSHSTFAGISCPDIPPNLFPRSRLLLMGRQVGGRRPIAFSNARMIFEATQGTFMRRLYRSIVFPIRQFSIRTFR